MPIHTERHAEKETWSVCAHLPYPLKGAITPHTKRPTVLPGFDAERILLDQTYNPEYVKKRGF